MLPQLSPTDRLARFVLDSRWQDIPPAVRHDTKRALINFLGTALGGSHDTAIEIAVQTLSACSGPAQCKLIGRSERLDMLNAAFVNAASGNVQDFDDTHHPTVIHPTSPIAPPVIALAETRPVSGEALLHALALGIEVACRLGNAVTPRHYVHGWHITSTCGVVGAAAACAKLLGLDRDQTINALGLAANQACGLVESLGSMAKSVSVGNAARNGLLSALLAQRGFTAAPATLEGVRGFISVLGIQPETAALTDALGERWEVSRNALKPYPNGVVLHPVVDACLALRAQHELTAASIVRVTVRGNPLLRQRADRPSPRSGREAAVSAQHTAAVCFIDGSAGVREYTDQRANDPAVQAFGMCVKVEEDPAIAVEAARVEVELADGRKFAQFVPHALGSLERPMSDAQVEAKVRDLAQFSGTDHLTDTWLEKAWRLDEPGRADAFLALLP